MADNPESPYPGEEAVVKGWAAKYASLPKSKPCAKKIASASGSSPRQEHRRKQEMPPQLPDGRPTTFSESYIPATGVERRARRGLIKQWLATRDPYVAAEMRQQELRELPWVEMLQAMYGTDCEPWRIGMCIEAANDPAVEQELARLQARAIKDRNITEYDAWRKAMARIIDGQARDEYGVARVHALFFVYEILRRYQALPTKAEVKKFLKQLGVKISFDDSNLRKYLFTGPYLGNLPPGKGGRPRTR